MNVSAVEETTFKGQLQQEWSKWRKRERKFLDRVTCWESYVKRKIRYIFSKEGKEVEPRGDE
jgi:hypothetical protein